MTVNKTDIFPRARATNAKSRSSVWNRLWRHHQNVNRASETHIWCVGIGFLIFMSWFIMSCKRWNNVCTLVKMCLFANSSVIRQWCAHGVISRYICACDSLSERKLSRLVGDYNLSQIFQLLRGHSSYECSCIWCPAYHCIWCTRTRP